MTLKEMAQRALDVQTACNLSGVVLSFGHIVDAMRTEHGMDTPTCNRHPVCRMFSEQIAHLTGAGMGDTDTYAKAYEECRRLADMSEQLPIRRDAMTKKDYIKFANMLTRLRKDNSTYDGNSFAVVRVTDVAQACADIFAEDNDRFDRGRFLKAAGEN